MTFRHSAVELYDRLKFAFTRGKQDLRPQYFCVPTKPSEELGRPLRALGIDDLITMEIPERELLLDPILPASGLMMIHARRGGSKTFLALAIGLAVARGASLMRWS